MQVQGKVVVVTGAAKGIGAAMARRFSAEKAAAICVSDRDEAGVRAVAEEISAGGVRTLAVRTDVGVETEVRDLVTATHRELGHIDLFCSNAGVAFGRGLYATNDDWATAWSVNVLSHVYAARAVVPSMLARGGGYLLNTASAAGLLTAAGDAPYTVSKHAAVAFAEWLSLTYGGRGVNVSVLCPQGVDTALLNDGLRVGSPAARAVAAAGEIISPERVADTVIEGLAAERFLILPHAEVAEYVRRKADDRDRWLAGLRRLLQPRRD
jgi:NAD(P)-dependent dehydrogenase (short-subunit alcohol dehydrogenase family)